jgi:hypothetical protein
MSLREFLPSLKARLRHRDWIIMTCAITLIASSIIGASLNRRVFDLKSLRLLQAWESSLSRIAGPKIAVAIPAEVPNEAAFHFYGNNSYAANRYDSYLVSVFPQFSYIRRDTFADLLHWASGVHMPARSAFNGKSHWSAIWDKVKRRWYKYFKPPSFQKTGLIVRPAQGRRVSGMVINAAALPGHCKEACFSRLLEHEGYQVRSASSSLTNAGVLITFVFE